VAEPLTLKVSGADIKMDALVGMAIPTPMGASCWRGRRISYALLLAAGCDKYSSKAQASSCTFAGVSLQQRQHGAAC